MPVIKYQTQNLVTSGQVFGAKISMEVNMGSDRNFNVNGNSERVYFNVNDNVKRSGSKQARIRRAQRIADDLVRKFGPESKRCYRYFCKCAYNLPEAVIWNCFEDCNRSKVTNKLAYFLAATKSQPQMA